MTTRPIFYGRQSITDADIEAVVTCLRGDFLTQGPTVARFEDALREATGARHAVAVANGTAALHLAYLAMGVGGDDVGLTSAVSFVATSNAVLYCGGTAAFADVDPFTGLVDIDSLTKVAHDLRGQGKNIKVIAPVDLAGLPTDRARVQKLARAVGAMILEDAAHSLGATYEVDGVTHRVGSCSHADAAILSFHPVKHVTTGEGGAIVTNDDALYARLLDLRTHGIHKDPARMTRSSEDPFRGPWYYEQSSLGFNYRITDLQCALGVSQMSRLDAFIQRRRAIAARYDEALQREPLARHFLTPRAAKGHAYHLYALRVRPRDGETPREVAARRKRIFARLAEQGVHGQVHYIPIPWQPYYAANPHVIAGDLPGAEAFYAGTLSIPMFPAMTDDDIARVIDALTRICETP